MKCVVDPQEVEALTPMPASVARLAGVVCDPNAGIPQIVEVIKYDEALTANALRLANSAWSGARKQIDDVRGAVIRVGVARILAMAVGGRVTKVMSEPCEAYELPENELWRHSVAAALATERMGRFTTQSIPSAAFTAALVHDIGKLLLARHVGPSARQEILSMISKGGMSFLEAERTVTGTDHAEVGGDIARVWGFPEALVLAIECHHDLGNHTEPLLDAVHMANVVAKLIGVGLGSEQMNMEANVEASQRLGLSVAGLESLCATVIDELAATEELLRSN